MTSVTGNAVVIRDPRSDDRAAVAEIMRAEGLFNDEEVLTALELFDEALANAPGNTYRVRVAVDGDAGVLAFICYGPTPMTQGAYDLYWIATHPRGRGRGAGRALCEAMEAELRAARGRLVRVETSSREVYAAAHAFYLRTGYPVVARIADFYAPGDDLLVMAKRL